MLELPHTSTAYIRWGYTRLKYIVLRASEGNRGDSLLNIQQIFEILLQTLLIWLENFNLSSSIKPKNFISFAQLMDSLRIFKLRTAKILLEKIMNLDLLMFRESLLALNQWSTFTSSLFDNAASSSKLSPLAYGTLCCHQQNE